MTHTRKIDVLIKQGEDERIAYVFDWASVGTPASATAKLEEEVSGTDVTATKLVGVTSILGTKVTMPLVTALVAGMAYRLQCVVVIGVNTFDSYVLIYGER